jgi:hypothetical protein
MPWGDEQERLTQKCGYSSEEVLRAPQRGPLARDFLQLGPTDEAHIIRTIFSSSE